MRKFRISSDSYYHIYNRGVNRELIFLEERNWGFFISLLRKYFKPEFIDIIAYGLMPNHYHMLVYSRIDRLGELVMQPFTVSYTKAINAQQNRVGSLFQGPYQARPVELEEQLSWMSCCIHLNPVEAGLVSRPQDWPYSSYRDFAGIRAGTLPLPNIVLSQFKSRSEYRTYVEQSDISAPKERSAFLPD